MGRYSPKKKKKKYSPKKKKKKYSPKKKKKYSPKKKKKKIFPKEEEEEVFPKEEEEVFPKEEEEVDAKAEDDNLIFSFSVGKGGGGIQLEDNHVQVAPSTSAVTFKCSYAASIDVTTEEKFSVKGATATGETTKTGELAEGFGLKLYVDEEQNTEANGENVIIGYPLYGDMTWSVSSVHNMVNFYVNECNLENEDAKQVKFIRQNCYATALGAENLQEEKLVGASSKFKFIAFIIGQDVLKMENAQVKCNAKLCLVDDEDCAKNIHVKDDECDQEVDGKSLEAHL